MASVLSKGGWVKGIIWNPACRTCPRYQRLHHGILRRAFKLLQRHFLNKLWWIWMDRTYWTNKWNPFIHVTYNKIKSAVLFTWSHITRWYMMTSSNGNIFRVTGPLWGEPTGHRWITHTMTSDEELWCFFDLRLSKHSWRRWFETPSPSLWKKSGSRCTKLWTNDTPYHTYTDRERCHCSYWWAFYNTTPP